MPQRSLIRLFAGAFLGAFAVFLIVPLLIRIYESPQEYFNTNDLPHRDTAIVLGASVYGSEPSPILARRADEAASLYLTGKVSRILISGDDSSYHKEVMATETYLLASGVPKSALILDGEGFDTYQSMYRARSVFRVRSAVVVTQDFHMPRALFLAHAEGIEAVGAVAQGGETSLFSYLREIPAMWKALFDVLRERLRP